MGVDGRVWVVLAALCSGGCSADGGEGVEETDGVVETEGTDSDGLDVPDMPGAECGDSPGRVGLHRLTRAEYNRTVRDLFGVEGAPADVLPPDPTTHGFDNNAASLGIDPQIATLLLDVAETVATEALDNGALPQCDVADESCIEESLRALALRVYRRPPSDAEIEGLRAFVDDADEAGSEFGFRNAVMAMLMAPQFLYRSVPASPGSVAAGEIVALDDYAIATRLAYFLWGSTPDTELLAQAEAGALRDADGLRAQFERMLADPKSDALFEDFVVQWLQLGKLGAATPDPDAFPEFDEALREAMADEVRRFFGGIRSREASVLEFLRGTETFANADLAQLYGVEGVSGSAWVPVSTDPAQRAGVLTMPAVLTMTSDPARTNVVKRGVWLAENMLCAGPPPPPDDIAPLPEPQPEETERERLERHRSDPACASCHVLIDPLGFGLENYDAVGRWRTEKDGAPIDNRGELPGGAEFAGAVELAAALEDDFGPCISQKMMTFAIGRAMDSDDACRLDDVASRAVTPDASFDTFLWTIVTSDAFLTEVAAEG